VAIAKQKQQQQQQQQHAIRISCNSAFSEHAEKTEFAELAEFVQTYFLVQHQQLSTPIHKNLSNTHDKGIKINKQK
jgi:hypothetical protein